VKLQLGILLWNDGDDISEVVILTCLNQASRVEEGVVGD